MNNNHSGPEMSQDQTESFNSSIGIGDKVEIVLNGKRVLGVVKQAEMINGRQTFNIKTADNNGSKGTILEYVPQEKLRKLKGSYEEEITLP